MLCATDMALDVVGASPSQFLRCVWENSEVLLKNCLANLKGQFLSGIFCQANYLWLSGRFWAPPTSENYREPCKHHLCFDQWLLLLVDCFHSIILKQIYYIFFVKSTRRKKTFKSLTKNRILFYYWLSINDYRCC